MYRYKPSDVDCKYCAEWRHRQCQALGCPWLAERIEAGTVSYVTVILKLFRNVKDADIVGRIGQLVLNFRGSLWLSAEHEFNTRQLLQSVGFGAWRDPRYFSALYLFGSNRTLLKRAWNACLPKRFIPEYIWLHGISPHDYALVTAAKTILGVAGFEEAMPAELLADTEVIDDEAFRLIVNALLIANYGPAVLKTGGGSTG